MKSLLFVAILFSSNAFSLTRYLVPCEDGSGVCNVGASFSPKNVLCKVPDDQDGSLYKVEIANQNDGLIEKAKELIGLDAKKEWTPGYELEKGEFIACSIDSTKVEAKEAVKAQREAEAIAKKNKDKNDWEAACADSKDPVTALICKERGY